MEGIILRKNSNHFFGLLLALGGVVSLVLFFLLRAKDPLAGGEILLFLIAGLVCCLLSVPLWLWNRGAFLRLDETGIRARYNWLGRVDCSFDEVAFAQAQLNTLVILLKNGKRHSITGVSNTLELSQAILRSCYRPETQSPDALQDELKRLEAQRKKGIYRLLGIMGAMFALIFLAIVLTGGRDIPDFSRTDWIIVGGLCVVELALMAVLFPLANRSAKEQLPIAYMKYRMRGALLLHATLPSNQVHSLYVNAENTGRVIVCGFPNRENVYYCVQRITGLNSLEAVRDSEIFDNLSCIPQDEFDGLIEVTDAGKR